MLIFHDPIYAKANPKYLKVNITNIGKSPLHMPSGFFYWKESERSCQRALYRATWPNAPADLMDRLYNGVDVYENSVLWNAVRPLLFREGML